MPKSTLHEIMENVHNMILALVEYNFVYTLRNLNNKKRVDFSTLCLFQ